MHGDTMSTSEELRGEYNVENLKLSRDRHENCKTHPKGNFFLSIYFSITKELGRLFT